MPIQGNLAAMFQKRSLNISVPPNISVKVSYWFPGYFPLIPFYEMWKITGTPLNPSLSSRNWHQQEPVTFFKLSHGFWEEPRSISKGVEQAPLSKESWELAMQVCAFVSFEWETFWITENILTFFFFFFRRWEKWLVSSAEDTVCDPGAWGSCPRDSTRGVHSRQSDEPLQRLQVTCPWLWGQLLLFQL